jgi:hypothetical protein
LTWEITDSLRRPFGHIAWRFESSPPRLRRIGFMAPDTSETDDLASLDDGDVPFEAPPGRMSPPRPRKRKKKRSSLIAFLALLYAAGAAGIGAVDNGGWYLLAWLVTVPMMYGAVRALRRRA